MPPAPPVACAPSPRVASAARSGFAGRIKAVNKVEVRAHRGFLEGQPPRPGRQGRRPAVPDRSAIPIGARRAGQSPDREATGTSAKLEYNRRPTGEAAVHTAIIMLDETRPISTGRGKVKQARAALIRARASLDYTDIKGDRRRIGRTVTQGNLVNPASGILATIVSQDPIYVLFPVSMKDLETIRDARRVEGGGLAKIDVRLRLANGEDYPLRGTWNLTDPQVDQTTDSVVMRATIANPDRMLVDGQFVTAIIRERTEQPRLVVPQAALQVDQAGFCASRRRHPGSSGAPRANSAPTSSSLPASTGATR